MASSPPREDGRVKKNSTRVTLAPSGRPARLPCARPCSRSRRGSAAPTRARPRPSARRSSCAASCAGAGQAHTHPCADRAGVRRASRRGGRVEHGGARSKPHNRQVVVCRRRSRSLRPIPARGGEPSRARRGATRIRTPSPWRARSTHPESVSASVQIEPPAVTCPVYLGRSVDWEEAAVKGGVFFDGRAVETQQ
jgi:hypothetical protein